MSQDVEAFIRGDNDETAIAVEIAKPLVGLLLPVNPTTLPVQVVKKGMK
jgi:hypothetical protein